MASLKEYRDRVPALQRHLEQLKVSL